MRNPCGMRYDPREILDANAALLEEASLLAQPDPPVLLAATTWGRSSDPALLSAVERYRVGIGAHGSMVARLPWALAYELFPPEARERLQALEMTLELPVCATVSGRWWVESWPRPRLRGKG